MALKTWLSLLLVVCLAPAAGAQSLPIKAFFGTYTGTGVAESKDSLYFGVTERDLDVVIRPAGSGFSVSWTTVSHEGGERSKPKAKHRQDEVTFVPGPTPGTWRTAQEPDPFSGNPLIWARLEGPSLIVYAATIDAEGRSELQRYTRTISGGGMDVAFIAVRDGERLRTVKGKLIKTGN